MSDKKKPLHAGHRQRLLEKIRKYGPRCLADHELLEVLLYYSIPRVNTNEIAHRILLEIGSIRHFFTADKKRLENVVGLGEKTLLFFSLLSEMFRRANKTTREPEFQFDSVDKVGSFLADQFSDAYDERFCALFLDGKMRLLSFSVLSEGSVNRTAIDPIALTYNVARENAAYVILAHNHPHGFAKPSEEDRQLTERIRYCLSVIGVPLVEHIIVGERGYAPILRDLPLTAAESDKIPQNFYRDYPSKDSLPPQGKKC